MSGNGSGFRALAWAWTIEMPATQKLVLVNIAGRCDQAFSCWPSVRLISSETGLHRATVLRSIDWLEANDLMIRATRTRSNGSQASSRYFINHPEAPHVTGLIDDDDDPVMAEQIRQATARAIARGVAHSDEGTVAHSDPTASHSATEVVAHGDPHTNNQ